MTEHLSSCFVSQRNIFYGNSDKDGNGNGQFFQKQCHENENWYCGDCAQCSVCHNTCGTIVLSPDYRGDKYKQMALNQQLKDTIIEPHRGSIYDTNMKTLATSKTVWDVVFEPANLSSSEEKREKELQVLCDPEHGLPAILGVSEETIREKAENRTSYWQVLQYKVEKEKADEVEAFIKEYNVNCITLSQGTKRVYPFDDLARRYWAL